MKSVKTIFVVMLLLIPVTIFAQQTKGEIKFDSEQHNFGTIQEAGGSVTHNFTFTNTGGAPLVITNVSTGCGCAVPNWTKQPVKPGERGFVTVVFDPRNMPGKFNKSLVVSSTSVSGNTVLRILGEVIPRESTIEDEFAFPIGSLRFKTNHLSFGNIAPGQIKVDSLSFINLSDKTLSLSFKHIPEFMKLNAIPQSIKPGQRGRLEITYNAALKNDWGLISDFFQMIISDNPTQVNYLYLSANLQEDFSKWTQKQIENAAVIEFRETTFDFGQLAYGEKVEHEYEFTNKGKSDLIIRKVVAGCGCTAIAPTKTVLKPGESSSIKAVFDSRGQKGRQNKGITVVTNDPVNPTVILRIAGDVLDN